MGDAWWDHDKGWQVQLCPACDGTGRVMGHYRPTLYVSREMALDAGMPEIEGAVYAEESTEAEMCEYCEGTGKLKDGTP